MPVNKIRKHGSFAPLSARYADDSAIIEAGEKAELLYVRALAWCAGHLDDGFISDAQLHRVGANMRDVRARARKLCDVGLWQREHGGYRITAWLGWNKSRAEILGEAAKDAGRKGSKGKPEPDPTPPEPTDEESSEHTVSDWNPNGNRPESDRGPNGFRPLARGPARAHSKTDTDTDTSAAPSELALVPRADAPAVESEGEPTPVKRAQALTRGYVQRVPLSKFPAVLAIVRKAIRAERYTDVAIAAALDRLADDGRPVTTDALRVELEGRPRRRGKPTTDDHVAGALAFLRDEPEEGTA